MRPRSPRDDRYDDERPESDIRKRAAWLLAMLAVVAGLFVLLSVTLFDTSGGGGTDHGGIADAPTGPTPTGSGVPVTPTAPASTTPASPSTSGSPTTSGPSTPVAAPSCPGSATCTVTGDVAGATTAINAFRARSGLPPVTVTTGAQAQRCALSSGNDCSGGWVWVRVTSLGGASVVQGVQSFRSGQELLDRRATSYQLGWAYDPGSKLLSCAVIRHD